MLESLFKILRSLILPHIFKRCELVHQTPTVILVFSPDTIGVISYVKDKH